MPPIAFEAQTVNQIAAELEKLAKALRAFKPGEGGSRTAASSEAILRSLQTINATLADAARRGSLGPDGFATIGREFEKIGKTLQSIGSSSK